MYGEEQGDPKMYEYNLLDRTDKATDTLSMARTTGYTCTAVVNLVADGRFSRKGICPPEYLGESEENFKFIVNYLKERGVVYRLVEN
jgi:saccharopine dehydrogenase-like NADP-dependent oxidoreductase